VDVYIMRSRLPRNLRKCFGAQILPAPPRSSKFNRSKTTPHLQSFGVLRHGQLVSSSRTSGSLLSGFPARTLRHGN
jgi:hypothetical protein